MAIKKIIIITIIALIFPGISFGEGPVSISADATKLMTGKWLYETIQTEPCAGTVFCPTDLPSEMIGEYKINLEMVTKDHIPKLVGHLITNSPLAKGRVKYGFLQKSYQSVTFSRKESKVEADGLCMIPTEYIFLTLIDEENKIVEVKHRIQWIMCGRKNKNVIWDQVDFEGEAQKFKK